MEVLRNTTGNAYAIKDYDRVIKVRAVDFRPKQSYRSYYHNKELWYETRRYGVYYVHNMDVVHVKHVHGYGYGISPLTSCGIPLTLKARLSGLA